MNPPRIRQYEPNENSESPERKRQLLGFDEVNFEQRREPYRERTSGTVGNPRFDSQQQPEKSKER